MAINISDKLQVRSVTEREVTEFAEDGWVKLPGLIDPASAASLLERAKCLLGRDGGAPGAGSTTQKEFGWFRVHSNTSRVDERFAAINSSPELGRNIARLFGRDSSIRAMNDSLIVKLPAPTGLGNATDMHQDTRQHMFVEGNTVNLWLALDEVTPEMGAMEFYSRSHRLGNMGNLLDPDVKAGWSDRLEYDCEHSGPVHLHPGDATIHTNFTVHTAGPNVGNRPRWAWGAMFLPGDALYTGARSPLTDGKGLEPFGPIAHPDFPIIYSPGV